MSMSNLQARRATVDDLAGLRKLWHGAGLPVADLERQLKDFQVVETPDGTLLGALALQIEGQQGRLHSEAYGDPEFEAELQQRLWDRVQSIARNHGLYRIWTTAAAPFWKSNGFENPTEEWLKKIPRVFGELRDPWLVLRVREEPRLALSAEHEFELFTQAQRESSERLVRQAQMAKKIAYLILFAVLFLGLVIISLAVLPRSGWTRFFKSSPQPASHELQGGATQEQRPPGEGGSPAGGR